MHRFALAAVLCFSVTACGGTESANRESSKDVAGLDEVSFGLDDGTADVQAGEAHYFYDRETPRPNIEERAIEERATAALLTFHHGTVLTANKTQAIFWGSQWNTASFAGDKITGMDTFFEGFGGSRYAGNNTEYTGTNGQVTTASTYLGHTIDTSTPPAKALSIKGAVAEGCKITSNKPDPEALYLIYTSSSAPHAGFCAWHSYGVCKGGAPIQVAYMPNLDGLNSCNAEDTWTTHSEGLSAIANVTGHELSEAITDPRSAGWYDNSNQENGDKCAWSWEGPVTLANNTTWKIQMLWSNKAYSAGTGLANTSGQKGCIQGE